MSNIACPPLMPQQSRAIAGPETTFGAMPSTGLAVRVTQLRSSGLPNTSMVPVPEIGIARHNPREPHPVGPGLREPTCGLGVMLDIENFDWILPPFFGVPTVTAGSGADAGFSQRLFRLGTTGCVQSLWMFYEVGDVRRAASGLVGDTLTIPLGRSEGFRQLEATYAAADLVEASNTVPATITQPRAPYYASGAVARVLVNNTAIGITDGSLTITNGVERRPQVTASDVQAPRPGRMGVQLSLSLELENQAQLAAYRGLSGAAPAVSIELWPDATNRRRVIIDLPTMRLATPDVEFSADAPSIPVTVTGQSVPDPTNAAASLAIAVWRATA